MNPDQFQQTLSIERTDRNDYTVRCGDRYIEHLTWDEMLGQVAYITCPKEAGRDSLFMMKTKEEWDAEEAARQERYKHLEVSINQL